MIELMIAVYCMAAVDFLGCEKKMDDCIRKLNQIKYEESMWLDVPDNNMSRESFKECRR